MIRRGSRVAAAILVALLAAGCGEMTDWWLREARTPSTAEVAHRDVSAEPVEHGAYIFAQYCAACHGPNGIGRTTYFPTLRANPFVAAAPESALRIVLHGRGLMPPFRDQLSNEEIAAVITFVRTAWNDEEDLISPEVVQSLR